MSRITRNTLLFGAGEPGPGMPRRLSFTYRPRGGKTLHADILLGEACGVLEARFTGDFFVCPEEALEGLEEALRGCRAAGCIRARVAEAAGYATAVGFAGEALAERLAEEWMEACPHAAGTRG